MAKRGRKTIEERRQLSITLPAEFIAWITRLAKSSGIARGALLRECALAGKETIANRVRKTSAKKRTGGGNEGGK